MERKVTAGEYAIKKVKKNKYKVYNTVTGKVHSYHTTLAEAKHQKQLLYAVGHGWKPTDKKDDGGGMELLTYREHDYFG